MTPTDHVQSAAGTIVKDDGIRLAYTRAPGFRPGVLFLGGFHSTMEGVKARALDSHCRARGRAFLRFDYFGHGLSDGNAEGGTIGRWTSDALFMLDNLTDGPQILVGSSLGGWIALLTAMARPDRIAAILCISAAVDFTEHVHDVLFDDEARLELEREGRVLVPDCHGGAPFAITKNLITEARQHLLLPRRSININVPVWLIHGQQDQDIPWETSLKLAEKVAVDDVEVGLIKDGEHELSRPRDIERLLQTFDRLAANLQET